MKRALLVTLLLLVFPLQAGAGHLHSEREYQTAWCNYVRGAMEVSIVSDGRVIARVDCITRIHAIEFDFAGKWQEAVGQAIYYSVLTDKKAGIVLIIEEDRDWKYYDRLERIVKKYDIDTWFLTPKIYEGIK